jgi:YD repeat-containing protein
MVEPRGDASGANPSDHATTYTYDAAGNPLTVTTPDPDGAGSQTASSWESSYDDAGLLDTVTDSNGNETDYDLDAANHLTQVTAPDPDGTGSLSAPVTEYTYTEVGDVTSRTDANEHTTSYAYNDARRLVTTTAPLSRQWT